MKRLSAVIVLSLLIMACSLSAGFDTKRKKNSDMPIPTVTLPSLSLENKPDGLLQMSGMFVGQDGQSFAGELCQTGKTPDNIHIMLEGLRSDVAVISYRVEDPDGGGVWAYPCDPVSNWLLYVVSTAPGTADLYFKPFRDAPPGTAYKITIDYDDGTHASTRVIGDQIKVSSLSGLFIGQDGQSYSGTGCTTGTTPDNVHIQVRGFQGEIKDAAFRVEDIDGHGLWAYPCNPASNWMLHITNLPDNTVDLYFKPFRQAPEGTRYRVTVIYRDGSEQEMILTGSEIGR